MTQHDVITVAAMEGVGVAAAMQQQQAISGVHQALPTCFYSTGWSPPMAAAMMHFILDGRDSGILSHLVCRIASCGIAPEISPSLLWLL